MRSYETREEDVKNIIAFNRREIAQTLHDEMFKHVETAAIEYQAQVYKGFRILSSNSYAITSGDNIQDFRSMIFAKRDIRDIIFKGFKKSLFPQMKFDSDTECRFAILLEDTPTVSRWFKPTTNDIFIEYSSGKLYEPDFIVETSDAMLLVEIKAANEMSASDVLAKAEAAKRWCEYASEHALKNEGRPWKYALVPDTAVLSNATLDGIISKYKL